MMAGQPLAAEERGAMRFASCGKLWAARGTTGFWSCVPKNLRRGGEHWSSGTVAVLKQTVQMREAKPFSSRL